MAPQSLMLLPPTHCLAMLPAAPPAAPQTAEAARAAPVAGVGGGADAIGGGRSLGRSVSNGSERVGDVASYAKRLAASGAPSIVTVRSGVPSCPHTQTEDSRSLLRIGLPPSRVAMQEGGSVAL